MLATWRLSFMCVSVSTGDPVSQHSQSLCSLAHSLVRTQPGLVRSLAHSSFQFASESKGLIKSPQTGFSGISRVNAKESQAGRLAATFCTRCAPLAACSLCFHRDHLFPTTYRRSLIPLFPSLRLISHRLSTILVSLFSSLSLVFGHQQT